MNQDSTIQKLEELLKSYQDSEGKWLILTHTDPDPDAIGSCLAAKKILEHYGLKSEILIYGDISNPSNKSLINRLEIDDLKRVDEINLEEFKYAMILDATELNVDMPEGLNPIVTIDHHEINKKDLKSKFADISVKERNSTSTKMVEYIQGLKIPMKKEKDTKLATALNYGIYSDTTKGIHKTKAEHNASAFLAEYIDYENLEKIAYPDIPQKLITQKNIATKKENMVTEGPYLLSFAGTLEEKEYLSSIVDELVRTQSIETAICYGLLDNHIHISVRTRGDQVNCGDLVKKIWGDHHGGGRVKAGGAKIPLGYLVEGLSQIEQEELVKKRISEDVFQALHIKQKEIKKEETNGNS